MKRKITYRFLVVILSLMVLGCQKNTQELNTYQKESTQLNTKGLSEVLDLQIEELTDTSLKKFLRPSLVSKNFITTSYFDDDYRREVNSTFMDILNFPVNIIVKENYNGNLYLTSQGLNKELIFTKKNNSENQNFYLSMMPLTGYLILWSNVNGQRKLVSAGRYTNNPNKDILYVKDGSNSIGAAWSFLQGETVHAKSYILQNADVLGYDGPEPTMWNVYNKVIGSEGVSTVYFDKYRNTGRQEFEVRPVDDFEIEDIEYISDASTTINQQPDFVANWFYTNNTSVPQSMSTSFSQRASRTSSFSQTTGGTMAIGASVKVKVGAVVAGAEVTVNTNMTTSYSASYGKSETSEDGQTYNFPISIAPRTSVTATATVGRYLINLKYKARMKGKSTGKIINAEGRWEGVSCTTVRVTVEERELGTNRLLKRQVLDKIPTSLYVL